MDMTDALASLALLVALALALMYAWERLFPADKSAADLGYIPDSEAPPWGWPLTILGTIAVIAIFIGLFGYVGSAVFLG